MPRKKSHHKADEKSERLEYRFTYRIDRKKFAGQDLKDVVQQARRKFLATGESIPGVELIGHWRNPDNRNPLHSDWKSTQGKGQSLPGMFRTLHGGRGGLRKLAELPLPDVPEKPITKPSKRVARMKRYWSEVKAIRKQHPKWTVARARKEWRGRR